MKMTKIFCISLITIILFSIMSCAAVKPQGTPQPGWVSSKPLDTDELVFLVGGPELTLDEAKQKVYQALSNYLKTSVTAYTETNTHVEATELEAHLQEQLKQSIVAESAITVFGVEFTENWLDIQRDNWWVLARVKQESIDRIMDEEAKRMEAEAAAKAEEEKRIAEEEQEQEREEKAIAESLQIGLETALLDICPDVGHHSVRTIGLGTITIQNQKVSSEFSAYLKSKITSIIHRYKYFSVIDGPRFYQQIGTDSINVETVQTRGIIIEPQKASTPTASTADNPDAQGILYGEYWMYGDTVSIYLYLKDFATGEYVGSEEIIVPVAGLPEGISHEPENYQEVMEISSQISRIHAVSDELSLETWVDKGNGATYTEGENMVLYLRTSDDCYVKLYHISATGEMQLIFPNRFDKNNRIRGGKVYSIGDSSYAFQFVMTPPFGSEIITAVASTAQFEDLKTEQYSQGLKSYGNTRGIDVVGQISSTSNDAGVSAISNCIYTIVPN